MDRRLFGDVNPRYTRREIVHEYLNYCDEMIAANETFLAAKAAAKAAGSVVAVPSSAAVGIAVRAAAAAAAAAPGAGASASTDVCTAAGARRASDVTGSDAGSCAGRVVTVEEALILQSSASLLSKPIMKLFNGMTRAAALRRFVSEQMIVGKVRAGPLGTGSA